MAANSRDTEPKGTVNDLTEDSPEECEMKFTPPDDVSRKQDICELEHLRKLFIGGLAPYTTEESLKEFYGQWGHVVDVVVMRDTISKRSRGFGFITYTKSSMVDKAQENRPHIIDGKTVEAKRALPRPERESREVNISVKKLFVGGLKDNHDEETLTEYFTQFGKVISVKILVDRTTGKRRGFAFIEFDDYDAVDKAILQKNHSIKYVVVDVKKSVYNQEQQNRQNQMQSGDQQGPQSKMQYSQNNSGPPQPMRYNAPMAQPPQNVPPYQPQPPMNPGHPPYNYWGPPPPANMMPPQPYGYPQPPPPQMGGWNYPPNGWNPGPAPPPAHPPAWQPHQWGPPPPGPVQPPAGPVQPNWNVQQRPVAPVPPPGVTAQPQQQQQQQQQPQLQQPPSFGSGYQQSYGGGPQKHTMNGNRMNPYNTQQTNYGNKPQQPTHNYNGYNQSAQGPPVNGNSSKPVTNGQQGLSGNKYRR